MNKDKIVLAYSGGLDTSVIIPWLQDNYDAEIVAVCINIGQEEDFEAVHEKALASGASKFYAPDVSDEFVEDFVYPAISADLKYQGQYRLGTALARPLIAKELVKVAHKENAVAICHGCTGKGNDQVRFEMGIAAFDPDIKVIAPWRIWDIKSREEQIEYAHEKGVPVTSTKEKIYSEDENLMHISHEGGDIESPANEVDYEQLFHITNSPEQAPDESEVVEIRFEKGRAVALNGEELSPKEILARLNKIGGKHAIGIDDLVEDRMIGLKSRGIYETPGASILMDAHRRLDSLVLTGQTLSIKRYLSDVLANLVYTGEWYSMAKEAIQAFMDNTAERATGTVKLRLYKGNIKLAGMTSDNSLLDEDVSGFGADDLFNHKDAEGFINIQTLETKIQHKRGLI